MRFTLFLAALGLPALGISQDSPELRQRAFGVLQTYCMQCHGDDFKYPALDLRDRSTLLRPKDESEKPFLTPGKLDDSRIWERVDSGNMPPDDQRQPTAEDKAALKAWILAGAEFPESTRPKRPFVGERSLLSTIAADLQSQPANRRIYLRYFSLVHLWNNPDVTDEQLRLVRAGVSKLINSLSSQPRIVVPVLIGQDGLVMRIDLRDYGWTHKHHWRALLHLDANGKEPESRYPYGLAIGGDEATRVYELTGCDLPYLRADWFVHQAARPPLYHQLVTFPDYIGVPERLETLERLLSVDLLADFEQDKLWRAAFSGEKSGVSDHNRMVERHDAKYGYYWPSYDSAGDFNRQNFFKFPLGPEFPDRNNLGAFKHDGGEMIFSLPNGLQAYMLATSDGKRINVGPQAIVKDPQQFSGGYDIVNGISCMGCHRQGMIPFTDTLRQQFEGRSGAIADKVLRLYPEKEKMDVFVAQDRQRFMNALQQAIGGFFDKQSDISKLPEPVTAVAKMYDHPLSLSEIAFELGLPESQQEATAAGIKATAGELATVIKFSEKLRQLELTPLTVGEPITRQQWEQSYQRAARELGIGTPQDVL
jgi:serine/threonine-protein kinase